jgi:hypothetical protein
MTNTRAIDALIEIMLNEEIVYAQTTTASARRDLIGFWQRFGKLFPALRLQLEPFPHQQACSRL